MYKDLVKMSKKEQQELAHKRMKEMEGKLNEKQKSFYNQIPDHYKMNYLKAITTNSRQTAIKAKCLDCCCWQINEIKRCSVVGCSLWKYRPYQNG